MSLTDSVLADLAGERAHQRARGYDSAHDDAHTLGELVSYARGRLHEAETAAAHGPGATKRSCLVQAGALVVAAIEREDRLNPLFPIPSPPIFGVFLASAHGPALATLIGYADDAVALLRGRDALTPELERWIRRDPGLGESWMTEGQRWLIVRLLDAPRGAGGTRDEDADAGWDDEDADAAEDEEDADGSGPG